MTPSASPLFLAGLVHFLGPAALLTADQPARVIAEAPATVYWPGDGYSGGTVGCPAASLRLYGTRRLTVARRRALDRDGLHVVAMRAELAPCGAVVAIEHEGTGLVAHGIVLDRGPYSCYRGQRRITALRCQPGWERKSFADLPPSMARELGHTGLDRVIVRLVDPLARSPGCVAAGACASVRRSRSRSAP